MISITAVWIRRLQAAGRCSCLELPRNFNADIPIIHALGFSLDPLGKNFTRITLYVPPEMQLARLKNENNMFCNAHMPSRDIRRFCIVDQESVDLLRRAITKLGLSARAYDRILKVSRTIADLEASTDIAPQHISEAIQYRSLDRNLWMN